MQVFSCKAFPAKLGFSEANTDFTMKILTLLKQALRFLRNI